MPKRADGGGSSNSSWRRNQNDWGARGQSDDEELPEGWPRAPQSFWFRRHDEFDEPPPSARLGIDADDRP